MTFVDYKRDLQDRSLTDQALLDRYFNASDRPSAFQGAPQGAETDLKSQVGDALFESFGIRVHHLQLVIVGSALLGFRPVPGEGFGRSFDPGSSDIDIAVVSPELFDACWAELQDSGLQVDDRFSIARDLLLGFINPANVRSVCEFGRKWWETFGAMKTDRAAGVRGRLYRNPRSMDNYHRQAVVEARRNFRIETDSASATAPQPVPPDLNSQDLVALAQLVREAQSRLPWVGLTHFRDRWLPDFLAERGMEDSYASRDHAIDRAIEEGVIRKVLVPNPSNPEFPTAALETVDEEAGSLAPPAAATIENSS